MSLITKIGGKESNSFVTLAEADEIIGGDGFPDNPAEWEALEDLAKEYRLRLGAHALSLLPLKGQRVFCDQALCFPRSVQANYHMIPDVVKETQCFIAYAVVHRGLASRPDDPSEAELGARVKSVSLGGLLSVSFDGTRLDTGSALDKVIRTSQFPAYLDMMPFLTQFRGGAVPNTDELSACVTTTTTSSTTTTTT
jgi:hypothetical protein